MTFVVLFMDKEVEVGVTREWGGGIERWMSSRRMGGVPGERGGVSESDGAPVGGGGGSQDGASADMNVIALTAGEPLPQGHDPASNIVMHITRVTLDEIREKVAKHEDTEGELTEGMARALLARCVVARSEDDSDLTHFAVIMAAMMGTGSILVGENYGVWEGQEEFVGELVPDYASAVKEILDVKEWLENEVQGEPEETVC